MRSLVWEDPLEEGMATHLSIFAQRIPWTELHPHASNSNQRMMHINSKATLLSMFYVHHPLFGSGDIWTQSMCRGEAIQRQSGRQVSVTKSSPTLDVIQLCGFRQVSGQRARVLLFNFALESESEVTQSCLTLCNPMDCSLPGSSVHGILQARILKWVVISFHRGSSRPRH